MKELVDTGEYIAAQNRLIAYSQDGASDQVKADIETIINYASIKRMEALASESVIKLLVGKGGAEKIKDLEIAVKVLEGKIARMKR